MNPRDGARIGDIKEVEKIAPQALRASSVSLEEVREVFSELAFMIQSGIPLFTCLGLIANNVRQNRLKKIIEKVRFDLSEGITLSSALRQYPRAFNQVQTSMILIGEASGNLEAALEDLVKMIDDERDLRDEIRKAVAYPIFMLSLSTLLVGGMLLFIFPKFRTIFLGFKAKLPIITTFFMNASQFMVENIELIIGGLVIIPLTFFLFQNVAALRYIWDRNKFKVPLFGHLFQSQLLARYGRIIGSLLSTGVPLVESLQLYRSVSTNLYIKESFDLIIAQVKEGVPLSDAVLSCYLFTPITIQLIKTGENTGELDTMSHRIFEFYRKKLSIKIKHLITILEPTLLAVMGGIVSIMAISVMLPLFRLAGQVRRAR